MSMTILDDIFDAKWKSEYDKKEYRKLVEDMFSILGNKCARCGFSDKRALYIDHINGDGKSDRLRFKNVQKSMLRYYVKAEHQDEARQKLQILCANCNQIKKIENNEIPYNNSSLFG